MPAQRNTDTSSLSATHRSHAGIPNEQLPVLQAFNRNKRHEGPSELREVSQVVTGHILGVDPSIY